MSASHALAAARSRVTSTDVLAAGGVAAIGVALLLSPDHIEDGPVVCPFRRMTGLPCPGCGMTRSWVYAAHGWWRESFLAHPFGLVAVLALLVLAGLVVRARLRRTSPPDLDRLVKHPAVIAVVAAWLAFSAVRLVLAI